MINAIFEATKQLGTAGLIPVMPWEIECHNCGKENGYSMNNGGLNGVFIIDRIGVRSSDMYTCDGCGAELYDVAQYLDVADGWSSYESHKIHYPKYIRYMDLDQQDIILQLVNMSDATQPMQRLSTVSLMLAGVWDIFDKMLKQAIMKGDINQYDCNTMMNKSVELRDMVHKAIDLVKE